MISVPPPHMVCPPPTPAPPIPNSCSTEYNGDAKLRKIADEMREILPLNAILPSEQVTFPSVGEVRFFLLLKNKLY